MSLTFKQLRDANLARLPLFKNRQGQPVHSQPDGSDWKLTQWVNATAGELGELAELVLLAAMTRGLGMIGNLAKKVERGDFPPTQEAGDFLDGEFARELADVQTYLDILAYRLNIDLGKATREKFNEVSRRVGCDVRIAERVPYAWIAPDDEDGPAEVVIGPVSPETCGTYWKPVYRD